MRADSGQPPLAVIALVITAATVVLGKPDQMSVTM